MNYYYLMSLRIQFANSCFFFNFAIIYFQLIQELKKENFDLKLRLYMEQKEKEVSHCGVGVLIWLPFRGRGKDWTGVLLKSIMGFFTEARRENNRPYHSLQIFFLFIGRELTTWPANNCQQIMVCSCAMSSNFVSLRIIFCYCVNETTLFFFLRWLLRENGRSISFPKIFNKKNKLGDLMIKQWLNSVVAKYRDLSVSRRSVICLSLRLRPIIDLLATNKSRYFAQPRPLIVNH